MRVVISFCLLLVLTIDVSADTYRFRVGDEVVGNVGVYVLKENDNFLSLAQKLRVGFNAVSYTHLTLPTKA